jgi:hypothetical protein
MARCCQRREFNESQRVYAEVEQRNAIPTHSWMHSFTFCYVP